MLVVFFGWKGAMQEIIKVNSQFNGITVTEFNSSPNDDCRVVCLSTRQVTVIRKALQIATWRTRYGEYISPNLWRVEDNSDLIQLIEETEVNLMANCFDDAASIMSEAIVTASENLAFAISSINIGGVNVNCGGYGSRSGSGGAGTSAPAHSETQQGTPGYDDPPEGYTDWSEFNADKCAIATSLVNGLIGDVGRASTINFELQTVATLVVILAPLLLDPIPFDEIVILCGILIAVHEQAETILNNMQSVMQDGKDELICAFYNASNSAAAESNFEAKWSELWYDSAYENVLYNWAAIESVKTMVTPEMTNMLFEKQVNKKYTGGDCVDCGCEDLVIEVPPEYRGSFTYEMNTLEIVTGERQHYGNECYYSLVLVTFSCPVTLEFVSATGVNPITPCSPPNQVKFQYFLNGSRFASVTEDPSPGDRFYVDTIAMQTDQEGDSSIWTVYPYQM